MSNPICFTCSDTFSSTPSEVAAQILDVSKWSNFRGYGPLPGIRAAQFENRTTEVVGSRVRVTNTDGSTHVEDIVEWQPGHRIRLRMHGFSPPLSHLSTEFVETWQFERQGNVTKAIRSFELFPRSGITRPLLWLISRLLKRAIARNLQELKDSSSH